MATVFLAVFVLCTAVVPCRVKTPPPPPLSPQRARFTESTILFLRAIFMGIWRGGISASWEVMSALTHPKICDSIFQGNKGCDVGRTGRKKSTYVVSTTYSIWKRCGIVQRDGYKLLLESPARRTPLDILCSANRSSHTTQFYLYLTCL